MCQPPLRPQHVLLLVCFAGLAAWSRSAWLRRGQGGGLGFGLAPWLREARTEEDNGKELFLPQHPAATQPSVTFDLVMSTKIVRGGRPASRMRFDRLEVFLDYTITTYSKLESLRRAFLFVELDPAYHSKKEAVRTRLRDLLGDKLVVLRFFRLAAQTQWQEVFKQHFNGYGNESLIWFLQNDDHPFIDVDESVWKEGLRQMLEDSSHYKALYPSHWPEIMKLSGKIGERVEVCGAYIRTTMTLLDAVQVMNFAWFRHILLEVAWVKNFTRVDGLLVDPRIWGAAADWNRVSVSYQTMFIPLREICRKFDGYQAQRIPSIEVPWLVLPPEKNVFDRSWKALTTLMTSVKPGRGGAWASGNRFKIPDLFLQRASLLYGNTSQVPDGCVVALEGRKT